MTENVKNDVPLAVGMTAEQTVTVQPEQTAQAMGSGRSPVLATPALVALMEGTAQQIVDAHMPDDWESVGIGIQLSHEAMTPVGMQVTVRAELDAVEGKELKFAVYAEDEQGPAGQGEHKRTLARAKTLARMLRRKK